VYDPFLGSGTTALMALKNKRHYLGSEISEEYYKLIQKRFDRAIAGDNSVFGNGEFTFINTKKSNIIYAIYKNKYFRCNNY
jgi:DNA modification methylase